jgi:hypothetical protein
MYASAQTARWPACSNDLVGKSQETFMYIGGGILGTVLLIVLILYLARRI